MFCCVVQFMFLLNNSTLNGEKYEVCHVLPLSWGEIIHLICCHWVHFQWHSSPVDICVSRTGQYPVAWQSEGENRLLSIKLYWIHKSKAVKFHEYYWRHNSVLPSHFWPFYVMDLLRKTSIGIYIFSHSQLVMSYSDKYGSTLIQILACNLMAPSHYQNQCCLLSMWPTGIWLYCHST